MKNIHIKYLPILYQLAIVGVLCLIFYLLYYFILPAIRQIISFLMPILAPFVLGWVIAALIEPIVSYLERRLRINRGWAAFLSLTSISGIFISIIAIGVSKLTVEMVKLSTVIPRYSTLITNNLKEFLFQIRDIYKAMNLSPQVVEGVSGSLSGLVVSLTNFTSRVTDFLVRLLTVLPNFLLIMVIAVIASYFISRDRKIIAVIAARILPTSFYEILVAISEDIGKAIFGYIRAQLILISITACQTVIGLYILGIDYAITMGLVVGFVDILPILGPGAVLIPWFIIEMIKGNFYLAVGLGIIYVFIILVRQVLEPKIVAENIGLHPLATLMSIFVGLKLFGFIGVILGPILLVIIKAASRGSILSKWI